MTAPSRHDPMSDRPTLAHVTLPDAAATSALAARLAPHLGPGDCLCLAGDLGAGKTHFARALIQARLAAEGLTEDVPSPTFTLVQTYQAGDLEIWHSDLYRLSDPREMDELGLTDAFDTALCLIEWPDRMAGEMPQAALWLHLVMAGEGREVTFRSARPDLWQSRLAGILPA